jgi:hypothetical protein
MQTIHELIKRARVFYVSSVAESYSIHSEKKGMIHSVDDARVAHS